MTSLLPTSSLTFALFGTENVLAGPEIAYLHGRGSSEAEGRYAATIFRGISVRAWRGPLREGNGHAWFVSETTGRAKPKSLEDNLSVAAHSVRTQADRTWICGFSNGAAMAAALLSEAPHAYVGIIMFAGCFPFPVSELEKGALQGIPALFCYGQKDDIIPQRLREEAIGYLTKESGALATVMVHDGGHELPLFQGPSIRAWMAPFL